MTVASVVLVKEYLQTRTIGVCPAAELLRLIKMVAIMTSPVAVVSKVGALQHGTLDYEGQRLELGCQLFHLRIRLVLGL